MSATLSSIVGSGPVASDGVSTSVVLITLKDADGAGIEGVTPTFSATNTSSLNSYGSCTVTNSSGQSSCTLKSGYAETKVLAIRSPIILPGGSVTFQDALSGIANSTMSATSNVTADNSSISTITLTLKDASNNPFSESPILSASGTGNTLNCAATNTSTGVTVCTLKSTKAETKTITIVSPGGLGGLSTTTTFVSGAVSTTTSSITTTSGITANNSSSPTILVTVKDVNENPISTTPTLSVTGTGNTYSCSATNASTGIASCTLTSTKAETKAISIATPAALSSLSAVNSTFVAGSASSATTTMTVAAGSPVANNSDTATFTVTLLDVYSNPIGGTTPTLSVTGTGNTTSCNSSNASTGISTCTTTTTKAENKTVSFSTPTGLGSITSSKTFIAGDASASTTLISVSGTPTANGSDLATVSITLLDANSNPISGVTPTISVSGSGNTANACSATTALGASSCTFYSTTPQSKTVTITSPANLGALNGSVTFSSAATKLVFSGPSFGNTNTCSTAFTVTATDANGTARNVSTNTTINLTGGGSGTFYSDSCSTATSTAIIPSGSSSITFYFRDATQETLTITGTDATTSLTSGWIGFPVYMLPNDISGLSLWLKADAITGLNDGDAVATWTDSSGNGKDAVQATANKKPTYKTNLYNSQPAVRLDGTDDVLTVASLTLPTYVSIFVVAKTTSAEPIFIEHGPSANSNDGFYLYGSNNYPWNVKRGAAGNYGGGLAASWAGSNLAILDWIYSGSGSIIKNGRVESTTTNGAAPGNSNVTDTLNIGSRNGGSAVWTDGDIAEIIIYDSALSASNRQNVENYLNAKYGVVTFLANSLWLKADAITGLNNGDPVSTWTDSSGNSKDASQATESKKPTFVTNSAGTLNGKPVVRFNTTNVTCLSTAAIDLSLTDAIEMYLVVSGPGGSNSYDFIYELSTDVNSSTTGMFMIYDRVDGASGITPNAPYAAHRGGAGYNSFGSTSTLSSSTYGLVNAVFDRSLATNETQIYVNGNNPSGTQVFNNNNTNYYGSNSLFLGARNCTSSPGNYDAAEIILFSRKLSTSERTHLNNYFNLKYRLW